MQQALHDDQDTRSTKDPAAQLRSKLALTLKGRIYTVSLWDGEWKFERIEGVRNADATGLCYRPKVFVSLG